MSLTLRAEAVLDYVLSEVAWGGARWTVGSLPREFQAYESL